MTAPIKWLDLPRRQSSLASPCACEMRIRINACLVLNYSTLAGEGEKLRYIWFPTNLHISLLISHHVHSGARSAWREMDKLQNNVLRPVLVLAWDVGSKWIYCTNKQWSMASVIWKNGNKLLQIIKKKPLYTSKIFKIYLILATTKNGIRISNSGTLIIIKTEF